MVHVGRGALSNGSPIAICWPLAMEGRDLTMSITDMLDCYPNPSPNSNTDVNRITNLKFITIT